MDRTFLAVAMVAAFASVALDVEGGKIPWNRDPQAAFKEAKKSGKPMMLFFTSDG